jgi:hypothetical protein
MKPIKLFQVFFIITICSLQVQAENKVTLFAESDSKQIQFAVGELQNVITGKGLKSVELTVSKTTQINNDEFSIILLNISDKSGSQLLKGLKVDKINELKEEGFIVHKSGKNKNNIWVLGKDEAGTMYGGLEVAEIIKVKGIDAVQNQFQNPYMKVRGTKYNIPLDMRSPTYTEPSDAAQNNMAEMWSFEFWKEYIDNLARYRYNLISLWNLHPFPSLVNVPEYP